MSRIAMDSISYAKMAGLHWPHLIGYVNGHASAWSPQEIADARSRGQLLALVDVAGTMPDQAAVLDFERGDVQSPAVVGAWVRARNQFAHDATVYVSPRQLTAAVSALRGEPCNLWVVDLTADGEPPFSVPHYPGLPGNVRVIGRQFVFGPRSGGDYDLSVFYADDWHPDQRHPANYGPVRLAAAHELGRLAWTANVPVEPDPSPAPVAITTTAEIPGQLELGADAGEHAAPLDQAAAAVDGAAAELAGAVLVASTAPDSPTPASSGPAPVSLGLAGVGAEPGLGDPAAALGGTTGSAAPAEPVDGQAGADAEPTLAELLAHHAPDAGAAASSPSSSSPGDGGAAAAGSLTAAAAAAQPTLNHEFIRRVLVDVGEVARQFRAGGWVHAAAELERAGSIAWELGSALKLAGQ